MAAVAEVLGFALPGSSLHPAMSAEQLAGAAKAGHAIVDAVARGAGAASLITDASLENAVRMVCALGGSTNAIVHLEAIAGRAGISLGSGRLREWTQTTPLLANVRPSGSHLLSDLQVAGAVPAVVRELGALFHGDTPTAAGGSWDELRSELPRVESSALHTTADPVAEDGLAILVGSLAPGGAVVKPITGGIRRGRGRAVVFEGVADLNARIDDDLLDVDADSVLVLRGVGTRGAPGIPEVGHIPIPARLACAGVTDMVRVTDARMSGTATGTVILHVTPESAVGGPLSLVRDGDLIEVDIARGTIDLLVPEAELAMRTPTEAPEAPRRGYGWLYDRHVLQPDQGCDFDFLRASGVG
jgi:dihydroxy-acid dehydratase